jgi:hypothetical protein|tara:strand:+ start:394 stop:888 length:495 start_codon:yes stop_codon:yes gene_type:complete
MNIFYLHKNPEKAARYQYNKHVVKMILESAQMLCTAHHCIMGEDANVPYKVAHRNHPSTIWTRQSGENYTWLYRHMMELGKEYERRYGKKHLSIIKCEDPLSILPGGILETGLTEMPQCMPDEYKDKCSVKAYWNYYIGEKYVVANINKEKIYKQIPGTVTTAL